MKKLILLEMNEVNFYGVQHYLRRGVSLPGFQKIIDGNFLETTSEQEYEQLEPWIQWPSVHTGLSFSGHGIFRLGDGAHSCQVQLFELIESMGFLAGAVSPMNAKNSMQRPAYFIPDPWTDTKISGGIVTKMLALAIRQAVNDNSRGRMTFKTIWSILLGLLSHVPAMQWWQLVRMAVTSVGKPWRKALFLDIFLHRVHLSLFKKSKAEFSVLFLNAGAHIQHHYFFNSPFVDGSELVNPSWYIEQKYDPFLEMLKVYDGIIRDLLRLPGTDLVLATGLSQVPYTERKFMYRLVDHERFLHMIGLQDFSVEPRMTQDFLVSFDCPEKALLAERLLLSIIVSDGLPLFGEVDNRGLDLFVVLTYPHEITTDLSLGARFSDISIVDETVFVCLKNGKHCGTGFAYFSDGIADFAPPPKSHVSEIHTSVLNMFSEWSGSTVPRNSSPSN